MMKPLTISDTENMIMAIQDEIRRNDTSRYDHRLHGVLLVAHGLTCPQVGDLLGDSVRTVVNWVQRFESRGLAGLSDHDLALARGKVDGIDVESPPVRACIINRKQDPPRE